jgi:hypothetical protein
MVWKVTRRTRTTIKIFARWFFLLKSNSEESNNAFTNPATEKYWKALSANMDIGW